jgi:hypothetical protein
MTAKMERLQARVREMESVALGRGAGANPGEEGWLNTWAFQARRELRRRRREAQAARAAARPQARTG